MTHYRVSVYYRVATQIKTGDALPQASPLGCIFQRSQYARLGGERGLTLFANRYVTQLGLEANRDELYPVRPCRFLQTSFEPCFSK